MAKLEGRVALVTGSGRGVGRPLDLPTEPNTWLIEP